MGILALQWSIGHLLNGTVEGILSKVKIIEKGENCDLANLKSASRFEGLWDS